MKPRIVFTTHKVFKFFRTDHEGGRVPPRPLNERSLWASDIVSQLTQP